MEPRHALRACLSMSSISACLLFSPTPCSAFQIEKRLQGAQSQGLILSHIPKGEPLAALRVQVKLKGGREVQSLTLRSGGSPFWSHVTPIFSQKPGEVEIAALAPVYTASAVDAPQEILQLQLQVGPETGNPAASATEMSAAATDLIDTVVVLEALDAKGNPLRLQPRFATTLGKMPVPKDGPEWRLRVVDRIHHIDLGLQTGRKVEVVVLDAKGRPVITLARGHHQPGHYSFRWDGRDAHKIPVGAGSYFLRLKAGPLTFSKKVEVR